MQQILIPERKIYLSSTDFNKIVYPYHFKVPAVYSIAFFSHL